MPFVMVQETPPWFYAAFTGFLILMIYPPLLEGYRFARWLRHKLRKRWPTSKLLKKLNLRTTTLIILIPILSPILLVSYLHMGVAN